MKRCHRDFTLLDTDIDVRPTKIFKNLEVLNDCSLELDLSHYADHSAKLLKELSCLCSGVSGLNLSFWNYLTDHDLISLLGNQNDSLPKIERVNISHTQVTDSGIRIIASKCPNLKRIDLSGCQEITDVSLSLIAQFCKNLQHLKASGCTQVGDTGVQLVAQEVKQQLRTLDLNDCPRISDKTLLYLGYYCPNLTCLRLKNTNVNVAVLSKLLSSRLHLNELDVQGLAITDAFLFLLLRSQQTLTRLNISFCYHVSVGGIQKIIEDLDLLEELHLFGLTNRELLDNEDCSKLRPSIFC